MHQIVGSFMIGAVAGGGVRQISWRSLAKGAMKKGIRLGRGVQDVSGRCRAELAQLVDEARAELAAEQLMAHGTTEGTEQK